LLDVQALLDTGIEMYYKAAMSKHLATWVTFSQIHWLFSPTTYPVAPNELGTVAANYRSDSAGDSWRNLHNTCEV